MVNVIQAKILSPVRFYIGFPCECAYVSVVEAQIDESLCRFNLTFLPEKEKCWQIRSGGFVDENGGVRERCYPFIRNLSDDIVIQVLTLLPELEKQLERKRKIWEQFVSLEEEALKEALNRGDFKDIQKDLALI